MADIEGRLGGRLPLLDRADLSPEQTTLWGAMDATMGAWAGQVGFAIKTSDSRFIGPFNPMLRSPAVAQTFLRLQWNEAKTTDLSDRVRQVVILSVGSAWKSSYGTLCARGGGASRGLLAGLRGSARRGRAECRA